MSHIEQSNTRPRLLDLFCGAGGAAVGYRRAGFEVIGIDIERQPNYPFEFHHADALDVLDAILGGFGYVDFQAIHASPPCQAYTQLATGDHPRLIDPVRARLERSGVPWVIENVPAAPLRAPTLLCGSMFGLGVRRHRLFECSFPVMAPRCWHESQDEIRAYYGKRGELVWQGRDHAIYRGSVENAAHDMGIDWMTWPELREAIPPAYTEHVGGYLLAELRAKAAA